MTTSEEVVDVVVDVDGLRMRYGRTDVLHDVTFYARRGEVLVVLGPNGRARPPRSRSWKGSGCGRPAGSTCGGGPAILARPRQVASA